MASNSILERQNQLRLQNIGCDVTIEIGAKSFPAHRVVLMAQLEYFQKMFTADMREKKELTVQFDPQIIDPDSFGDVLNYVYTSKIEFTLENLRPIIKAADYFCFDELTTKVKEHMKSSLKIENAVFYWNISVEFNLKSFEDRCEQFIVENSSSNVIKNQLTLAFSFEELQNFVGKLEKNAKFEETFNYSVDWILHDKPNRTRTLFELFKNIPWESLSFRFIKQNVSNNELVLKDNDCLALLLNTVLTISEERESQFEVLYAIGGMSGQYLSSVSEYNSRTNKWAVSTPMPSQQASFGCAVIGHKIYLCGGDNGSSGKFSAWFVNSLTVLDTDTRTWTQLKPMKHERYHCAAAELNGQIYVAGGRNGKDRLAVMERYNVETDQWSKVSPMTIKRSGLELVELNGFLYAIGGYDGNDVLNSVERYDLRSDQWTVMNETIHKYQAFGSAVLNGHIYIVGNHSCEVYSPADDRWAEMPAPRKCEYSRRLAVYNGKLYAIGGLVGELEKCKGSKTVQVFDFQARVWRPEPDMDVARCYHGVAVVKS